MSKCAYVACARPVHGKDLCSAHYKQMRRGETLTYITKGGKRSAPIEERFWTKVAQEGDCWVWQAGKSYGYGSIRGDRGQNVMAHRWAYEQMVGEIPDGLELDHLCRNRACVNPYHLDPVTHTVNVRRGASAKLGTHCARGHEFTPENTGRSRHQGKAGRYCLACRRERKAERAVA